MLLIILQKVCTSFDSHRKYIKCNFFMFKLTFTITIFLICTFKNGVFFSLGKFQTYRKAEKIISWSSVNPSLDLPTFNFLPHLLSLSVSIYIHTHIHISIHVYMYTYIYTFIFVFLNYLKRSFRHHDSLPLKNKNIILYNHNTFTTP